MGVVYRAIEPALERPVAVKVLKADSVAAGGDAALAREMCLRFLQEARSAAAIQHPGAVIIHRAGEVNGSPYIAMEWLDGENLAARLARGGALEVVVAVDLARQVLAALQAAHDAGVIHRDVKPANLIEMSQFPVHTEQTVPEQSRPALAAAKATFGFVPNLIGMLAESPAAAAGYLAIGEHFDQSSFTPAERQVVLLAVSYENGCDYCMAAHTVVAGMSRVPAAAIEALRTGTTLPDTRLDVLARFTRAVVRERGHLPEGELEAFLAAGFTRAQVLEVVLGVAMKTLSNYANHLARTPLDAAFAAARWEPARLAPVG
jgi:uncharacterized peroxidase-related enzyme